MTDKEWQRIKPLLPPQKPKTGRPGHDLRCVVEGIVWVQRTGAPWRQMPKAYGSWSTIASRYHRWRRSGVWIEVAAALNLNQPLGEPAPKPETAPASASSPADFVADGI